MELCEKLFFVDTETRERHRYVDLERDLLSTASLDQSFYSDRLYAYFVAILKGLLTGVDLQLTDEVTRNLRVESQEQDLTTVAICDSNIQQLAEQTESCCSMMQGLYRELLSSTSKVGLYTSGTTQQPRLIWQSAGTLLRTIVRSDKHRDDVWGLCYHPSKFAGIQVFLQAVCNANTLVGLLGLAGDRLVAAIEETQVTHLSSTPSFLRSLCGLRHVFHSVRSVTLGGEIADGHLFDRARSFFPNATFRQVYASTEFGSLLAAKGDKFTVPERLRPKVAIVNQELFVHRDLISESIGGEINSEFIPTGDEVTLLSEEPLEFRFVARLSDWINVGGYKVNPHRVEEELLKIDGVLDAKVYAWKNSVTGYVVACDLIKVPGASLTSSEVRRLMMERLPTYQVPARVNFVESFGSTTSGKKLRSE